MLIKSKHRELVWILARNLIGKEIEIVKSGTKKTDKGMRPIVEEIKPVGPSKKKEVVSGGSDGY